VTTILEELEREAPLMLEAVMDPENAEIIQ
jgi:hypothetical protein